MPWVAAGPTLARGDDGVQVAQDDCGDRGLSLRRSEFVVVAASEVLVAGAVEGVGTLSSPSGPPGAPSNRGSLDGRVELGLLDVVAVVTVRAFRGMTGRWMIDEQVRDDRFGLSQ